MPYTENQGTRIYWEEHGAGEPLVLVMGLASTLEMWHRVTPKLAERFRVIVYDNRGVGLSDVPPPPYTMQAMAADLLAVMQAAAIEQARVFGISMGGMIAQEFALTYPDRVRSLILGCTNFGGRQVMPAAPRVLDLLKARGEMPPDKAALAMAPHIYDKSTARHLVEEDLAIRVKGFPTPAGYYGQLGAILSWESRPRLAQLQLPTLIIHGETDELVPPENGRMLASLIANSQLVMLENASHIFFTDQPELTTRAVFDFFAEH